MFTVQERRGWGWSVREPDGTPGVKPKFVEPNLHVVQIQVGEQWVDYAAVKSTLDMQRAIQECDNDDRKRIVKKFMGTIVVYHRM
jgi:hypothetical protein